MAARLPDGAIISLATTMASPKTVSTISNANPGVCGATSNAYSNGDIVIMASGWSNLNNRVVRVAGAATDAFNLEGVDTSDTTLYPAGSGSGTATKITAFTQVAQIMNLSTSGGDQQFTNYSFMEQNFETQVPTYTSAMTLTVDIADDPSLAGYIAVKAAANARASRALKMAFPDGSVSYYYGYVSFNETPSVTKGQIMQVKATFSLQSRLNRYAS
jgi:hypothetical protein